MRDSRLSDTQDTDSNNVTGEPVTTHQPSRITFHVSRFITTLLWSVTALILTLLVLRFGLRFLGVRPNIPFPGFVYSLTAPLVEPFYRFFPVSDRFDYYAVEWASLLAAICVLAAALLTYIAGLLLFTLFFRPSPPEPKRPE